MGKDLKGKELGVGICQNVLNRMADTYCNSTIKMTSITMYGMFQSAVDNELILKNPMTKYVRCQTINSQEIFNKKLNCKKG